MKACSFADVKQAVLVTAAGPATRTPIWEPYEAHHGLWFTRRNEERGFVPWASILAFEVVETIEPDPDEPF